MRPSEIRTIYGQKGREAALEAHKEILSENPGAGEELAFLAADYAHPEALALLFEAGVSPTIADKYAFTLLHYLAMQKESRYTPKPAGAVRAATELLLDNKVSALRKDENEKMTCYHYAARNGLAEMVEALAARGTKLDMLDKEGQNGLFIACEYAGREIHSLQYEKQHADNAVKKKENSIKSAKERGLSDEQIAKYALDLDKDVISSQQRYEAQVAKIETYFLTVKAFVEGGVDKDARDGRDRTAQDIAVEGGAKKIAAYLSGTLTDGAGGSATVIGGMTLHQAAEKGDVEAIKAIAATGADMNGLSDSDDRKEEKGMTALAIACKFMKAAAVEALLDCGADPSFKDGNDRAAIRYVGVDRSEEKLIPKMIKDMVSEGMNINLPIDGDGNTLLVMACKSDWAADHNRKTDIMKTIFGLNPDINFPNRFGETALMHVCGSDFGTTENVQLDLLERGANVAAADKKGDTALHYAARKREGGAAYALCDMLLEFGADAGAMNNAEQTALDIATGQNNSQLVKLLLSKM
jgi:ankyrin repeat protein